MVSILYIWCIIFVFYFLYFCECDFDRNVARIANGTVAQIESYPFTVSIQSTRSGSRGNVHDNKHICGGVILSPWWILTAAHCLEHLNVSNTWACAGGNDVYSGIGCFYADRFITHPEYNKIAKFDSDIGLIKLKKPLSFETVVKPVALAVKLPAKKTPVMLAGFGRIRDKGIISYMLVGAEVKIINKNKCNKVYKKRRKRKLTRSMFCAMARRKGPCEFDSGGPAVMVTNKRKKKVLVGIISSEECGNPRIPDVYTSVPQFRSWIKNITGI